MTTNDRASRTVLPIPDQRYAGAFTYDATDADTTFPAVPRVTAPDGAANVLVILLDDVGFGASRAFGGPVNMPTAERLAAGGLKYTRFHTTALCSPTRAAMLSGRNHHTVGMGSITETATNAPGYNSVRPNTCAPVAEVLRLNGFSTAQFGKCHEVPAWETSGVGPFDHWPSPGNGFEYFYGFTAGETNQYYPAIRQGTSPVEQAKLPEEGYHFMEDMTDQAINWIKQQKALAPDRPFFTYFAPGATHMPHHVPKEWADKYKGQFDDGWEALRERTIARQKELGVVPQDADLTAPSEGIPNWDDQPEDLKKVLRRQMENYAGFLEFADFHTGRLIDSLDELGILEDTLVYYIIGDNGASAEGGEVGSFNGVAGTNGGADLMTTEYMLEHLGEWGGVESYPHYSIAWAHGLNAPYQWTKQVASHWGGTRNGTIVHWPNGFESKGELRHQFTHVIDLAPTIFEAAKVPAPVLVHGVTQEPLHGYSMTYSFDEGDAPETHTTQYFEMFTNRGIYHNGWSAVTKHHTPWDTQMGQHGGSFADDRWELYDGSTDWTQAHDLAKEQPEKLEELKKIFMIQAARFNVYPLDDRTAERLVPGLAHRPTLVKGKELVLFEGMSGLTENVMLDLKAKSFSITAQVQVAEAGGRGVLLSQGGRTGGWALFLDADGHLVYTYSFVGVIEYTARSAEPVVAGEHQLRIEFAYDGGGFGKGGLASLYIDGEPVGEGRVERTHITLYSFDETTDVGRDTGSPVVSAYGARDNGFKGRIEWIKVVQGDDDHSHLVPSHITLEALMAQQ
ncbi:sulfatase [Beutenbergia cavernae DSM 12333]|uniref:Sulfatase n=1 Tax=Beutenbergia cavernae (strain ATCC BAA-8 / DSM 12333 / CCUG 43141 / JCM 11478 / NBRC 16432 / NCIMB 13614 / HKI 0122) TaxID=471853 RepID=C5BYR6_BEUC1|nr:arylsulfatase [Beutenbergia cavernae]ACQ79024.1 sulfatase [Beutenbergia cavernae DSM 12333]